MQARYHAIVIGARCAGASTALLLGRRGYRVLLVDRDRFPRDIPHGHFIHKDGPRRLRRWGLLDRIVDSNCPPVTVQTLDLGDFPLVADDLVVDGVAWGYAPRRRVLDEILLDAAAAAGVEVRDGFQVDDVVRDGDGIVGICGRSVGGGPRVVEHARMTIGADGRRSRLARAVEAPSYDVVPTLSCYYFSYWDGLAGQSFEGYVRRQRVIFVFPTNDGLSGIFVAFPIGELPRVRTDIEGHVMEALDLVPDLAARVRRGHRVERFYGASDLPNFYRRPWGPGWALVGDAGHHKDPFLALGISDALRDAELLADAIDAGLSGAAPMDEALAAYERRRNEASQADYRLNLHLASFLPLPPEVLQLRAAVRGNREDARRYTMARTGMIPSEAFFNPENMQRLMAAAST